MNTASDKTKHPDSFTEYRPWLICLATIAGAFILTFFLADDRGGAQRAVAPAIQASETVGMRTPIMNAAQVRLELYGSLGAIKTALQSMSNAATVETHLPQLQAAADRLDRVNDLLEQLSPLARRGMAASLTPAMRPLDQMFDRVLAMPVAGESAKPTIDALRSKLAALSRA
jgi:hypothetical protein